MVSKITFFTTLSAFAIIFTACGDDITQVTENQIGIFSFESIDKLPDCSIENHGQIAIIKDEGIVYFCNDNEWQSLNGNDGIEGNDGESCTAKKIKNGYKIICGKDSVGVLYNGEKGENGDVGAKGDKGSQGDSGKNGENCKAETLKNGFNIICGKDTVFIENNDNIANLPIKNKTLTGFAQKGPFLTGGTVTIYELEEKTLQQTGRSFKTRIINNSGEYLISNLSLASQYVQLEANGSFLDETYDDDYSNIPITLNAIIDLSNRESANINILTHLEYERTLYLIQKGLSFADAKKQAHSEVLKAFEINGNFNNSEDLNIFGDNDGSAALLAISILSNSIIRVINEIATDIQKDGVWNNDSLKVRLVDYCVHDILNDNYKIIRKRIREWGMGTVPNFEKYVNNFVGKIFKLGDCNSQNNGEITIVKNEQSTYYRDDDGNFICKNNQWIIATDLVKDTFNWGIGEDAKLKKGDSTENYYVYDEVDAAWRRAAELEIEFNLGCTKRIENDSNLNIKKRNELSYVYPYMSHEEIETFYICEDNRWRKEDKIIIDTQNWLPGEDGELKQGEKTKTYYVYDKNNSSWRYANSIEIKFNKTCTINQEGELLVDSSIPLMGKLYYTCKNGSWVNIPIIEIDTQNWGAGIDGEIKQGDSTETYYVYDEVDAAWRRATNYDITFNKSCTNKREGDTFTNPENKLLYICESTNWLQASLDYETNQWGDGIDGELRQGEITGKYYVYIYEYKEWREATDLEITFNGGCTDNRYNEVLLNSNDGLYYRCDYKKGWIEASEIEYDTYGWSDGTDGELRQGKSGTYYVYIYEYKEWREATDLEIALNVGCTFMRNNEVLLNSKDGLYYRCDSKEGWKLASEIEYDTYGWGDGTKGEVRQGEISEKYYVYDYKDGWKLATKFQYDTYGWHSLEGGEIKKGNVTETYYTYDESAKWIREATDLEIALNVGCTFMRNNEVLLNPNDGLYYRCDSKGGWTQVSE